MERKNLVRKKMSKLKLGGIFNDEEENYFKIGVEDINSVKYIEKLISLLNNLNISKYLNAKPTMLSDKYKNWIGRHEYFRTKDYIIHIVFSKEYLHLIVKCSLKKRKEFIKILDKYYSF